MNIFLSLLFLAWCTYSSFLVGKHFMEVGSCKNSELHYLVALGFLGFNVCWEFIAICRFVIVHCILTLAFDATTECQRLIVRNTKETEVQTCKTHLNRGALLAPLYISVTFSDNFVSQSPCWCTKIYCDDWEKVFFKSLCMNAGSYFNQVSIFATHTHVSHNMQAM